MPTRPARRLFASGSVVEGSAWSTGGVIFCEGRREKHPLRGTVFALQSQILMRTVFACGARFGAGVPGAP